MNESLRYPAPIHFVLLVIGQIVSVFGSSLLRFALSLHVLDLTGRADLFALLVALSNIPLLLSPVGGALADRFNRRNLIVLYDAAGGAAILAFAMLLPGAGELSIIVIGAAMLGLALIGAMYTPAVMASIPLLVRQHRLAHANGIVSGVQALSGIAAPVIGGLLYGVAAITDIIFISGIVFLLSAAMEMFIRLPFVPRQPSGSAWRSLVADLKEGTSYMATEPYVFKTMLLAALLNFILTPFFIIGGPLILRVTMQSGDATYGIGMGLIELAIIGGALSAGFFAKSLRLDRLYRWLLVIALLFAPLALSVSPYLLGKGFLPSFTLFMIGSIAIALILTVLSVYVITLLQKQTPDAHLGKVMSLMTAASQCAAPAGQLLFGLLFKRFDTAVYTPLLAIGLLMAAVALTARRTLRQERGTVHHDV